MKELAAALPWVAFWLAVASIYYVDAQVFMSGRDSTFFWHKTPEEKALQVKEAKDE